MLFPKCKVAILIHLSKILYYRQFYVDIYLFSTLCTHFDLLDFEWPLDVGDHGGRRPAVQLVRARDRRRD
jgi:hypothetical protein